MNYILLLIVIEIFITLFECKSNLGDDSINNLEVTVTSQEEFDQKMDELKTYIYKDFVEKFTLNASNSQINDISKLINSNGMAALRDITLNFNENQINDISVFQGMGKQNGQVLNISFNFSDNQISDFSPICGYVGNLAGYVTMSGFNLYINNNSLTTMKFLNSYTKKNNITKLVLEAEQSDGEQLNNEPIKEFILRQHKLENVNIKTNNCQALANYQNQQYISFDLEQNTCEISQCMQHCFKCFMKEECYSCNSSYIKIEDSFCISEVDCNDMDYYFINYIEDTCDHCQDQCVRCSTEINCSQCSSTTFKMKESVVKDTCVFQCGNGFYENTISRVCDQCTVENCLDCSDSASQCKGCDKSYFLYQDDQCVQQCPDGYFPDESSQQCLECLVQNCQMCQTQNQCKQCQGDFFINEDVKNCVKSCDINDGYFQNNKDKICQKCTETQCKNCSINIGQCKECVVGYVLYEGTQCLDRCPDQYYDFVGVCEKCDSMCLQCTGSETHCLSCVDNYYYTYDLYKCSDSCFKGYYDAGNYKCIACSAYCTECQDSDTNCLGCIDEYVLQGHDCQKSCDAHYYDVKGLCTECDKSCYNCENTPTNCTSCVEGLYLSGSSCLQCMENCAFCSSQNVCSFCVQSYFLYNSTCVDQCPSGYDPDDYDVCQQNQKSDNTIYIIIIFSLVGVILLIILFVFLWRRRERKRNDDDQELDEQFLDGDNDKTVSVLGGEEKIIDPRKKKNKKKQTTQKSKYIGIKKTQDEDGEDKNYSTLNSQSDFEDEFTIPVTQSKLQARSKFKSNYQSNFKSNYQSNYQSNYNSQMKSQLESRKNRLITQSNQSNFSQNISVVNSQQKATINMNIEKLNISRYLVPTEITYKEFKDQYRKIGKLGEGTFGVVDKYLCLETQNKVAIKRIKLTNEQNILEQSLQEVAVLQMANHYCQYIVKLEKFFIIQKKFSQLIEPPTIDQQQQMQDEQKNKIEQYFKKQTIFVDGLGISKPLDEENQLQSFKNTSNNHCKTIMESQESQNTLFGNQNNNDQQGGQSTDIEASQLTINQNTVSQNTVSANNSSLGKNWFQKKQNSILPELTSQEVSKQLVIVLELADYSLAQMISEYREQKKKIGQEIIKQLLDQMLETLHIFHTTLDIAHRDIKPSNILIVNGDFKLCDFGVSKKIENTSYITKNHTLTGTLNYMSPEEKLNYIRMFQNDNIQPFNVFKSDIFSLGITMFEIITLKSIKGLNDNEQDLQKSIQKQLYKCTHVDKKILETVAKMLEWDQSKRLKAEQYCS